MKNNCILSSSDICNLSHLYNNVPNLGKLISLADKIKNLSERNFPYIPHVTVKLYIEDSSNFNLVDFVRQVVGVELEEFDKGFKFVKDGQSSLPFISLK